MKDVFWISGDPNAALAIVTRPRGHDWLEDELRRMQRDGIQTLVSMLEEEEADSLGLSDERRLAEQIGLCFFSYQIPDRTTPADLFDFQRFVIELADRVRTGEAIGIHCRGSIGRASIAAACTLIQLGWDATDALGAIETARGCPIPDTEEQRSWILKFEALS